MANVATATVITPQDLLIHWQGHRNLTRKVIEAFPETDLFNFSVGGMRPFSLLALEMIDLSLYGMKGVTTGKWIGVNEMQHSSGNNPLSTKAELLELWDTVTENINATWHLIRPEQFQETMLSFNAYEGTVIDIILYWIDNEIHHRGQGYVYLRALGIEPPFFWDRP